MKILIIGANGQIGSSLVQTLTEHKVIPVTRDDCDLNDLGEIKHIIDHNKSDLIINAAAYTKVDQAEDEEGIVFKINCDAPRLMAEMAREQGIPFIHFSTDYVFDGKNIKPYQEEDLTNPLGIYGASKLEAERAIKKVGGIFFIFRTSWIYSKTGHNFYLTIMRLADEKNILKVVNDQIGVPTSSFFIAKQIQKIIPKLSKDNSGTYHLVPNGYCSWYSFAQAILKKNKPEFDISKIIPVNTKNYPTKARRPLRSILDNDHFQNTFMLEFEDWKSELNKI